MRPWESEPDRKEWTAFGFPCVIIRQRSMGHLCGYVGVTAWHPLYGVEYWRDDFPDLEVHGGVTFSEMGDGKYLPAGYWWIGFDCAHLGDLVPNLGELFAGDVSGNAYRDINYVTLETEHLARQLADMVPEKEAED